MVRHCCSCLYIKEAAFKRSQTVMFTNMVSKYLHGIMSEVLRCSFGYYYNRALLIGQQAELIMQLLFLWTAYANDSQQILDAYQS